MIKCLKQQAQQRRYAKDFVQNLFDKAFLDQEKPKPAPAKPKVDPIKRKKMAEALMLKLKEESKKIKEEEA